MSSPSTPVVLGSFSLADHWDELPMSDGWCAEMGMNNTLSDVVQSGVEGSCFVGS
ncbi:MAG: hypothetical protein HOE38_03490 [Proteobacteria bacterium]|nr:hypothetical protein [Pseudomonadota bacterium]